MSNDSAHGRAVGTHPGSFSGGEYCRWASWAQTDSNALCARSGPVATQSGLCELRRYLESSRSTWKSGQPHEPNACQQGWRPLPLLRLSGRAAEKAPAKRSFPSCRSIQSKRSCRAISTPPISAPASITSSASASNLSGIILTERRRHPFMGPQCRARASLIGEVAQELLAVWLQPIRRNLSRFGFLDFHGMFSPSA
jgi:hypothetical protein